MDEKKETSVDGDEKPVHELTSVVERLEKANKEKQELLDREERLIALQKLGGKTNAGIQPEQPKEETPAEYVKKVMQGKI